ncbi:MAG: hypothetical protein QQN41_02170 [Nitrosopumilus sp.]
MPEINEINKSLGELEEELSKIKSASKLIQDAKDTAEKTINETKEIMSDLITNSKKATDGAIKESKKLNNAATELFIVVDDLMKKLDKVDFPTRLDKLDTTVSGINSSIQNVLGRFDSVERNLKDDLKVILYLLIGLFVVSGGAFLTIFWKIGIIGL